MAIETAKTIQFGALIDAFTGTLVETLDAIDGEGYEYSFVGSFSGKDAQTRKWLVKGYDWMTVCMAHWPAHEIRCVLSREGQVRLYGPGGKPDRTYQLPDAGVMREGAADHGYVNRIRAIGNSLYVCGQSRQVYRFAPGQPHVLDGQWLDFAGPMRQSPMSEAPDDNGGEAFNHWLDDNDAIDLVDIAGASESDIYTVGDECWHYDGKQWQQLELPTHEFINAIKVISTDQVVLAGHEGTLLIGNAKAGFAVLANIEGQPNLSSAELFEDKLFLASNQGLFACDLAQKTTERYTTTLSPDLQDTHILEAKDGVLWSFGFKDLAFFDGQRWTRVDHPDNPPIR